MEIFFFFVAFNACAEGQKLLLCYFLMSANAKVEQIKGVCVLLDQANNVAIAFSPIPLLLKPYSE